MPLNAKIKVLICTNCITLGVLATFLGIQYRAKEEEKKLRQERLAQPYHFADNPQYIEQVDFFSLFTTRAKIVMLGNSHIYRMHWDELLGRKDVVNRGIGSDITEGYLARMESVLNAAPLICFIEGGGNDIDISVPVHTDTIIRHIGEIVAVLKEHHIKPVLTTLFYASKDYPGNDSNQYNRKVAELNTQMHRLAVKDSLAIIDLNAELNEGDYLKSEYARKDGIHLNSKAYVLWKAAIERILAQERI